jgi:DNA-binding response OmpR family regulator
VDLASIKVLLDGAPITLPSQEYRLLVYFLQNAGRPVGRKELKEKVFGVAQQQRASNVRDAIYRLRRHLGAHGSLIRWLWRKGWGIGLDGRDSVEKK